MAEYKCQVEGCNRSFPKAQGLAVHMRRAHGPQAAKPDSAKQPGTQPPAQSKAKKAAKRVVPETVVMQFCPHCGYALEQHARAYMVIGGLKRG